MTDWLPRLLKRLRGGVPDCIGPAVAPTSGEGDTAAVLRAAVVDLVMASEQHPGRRPEDQKRLGQAWDRHLTRFRRAELQAGMDDLGPRVRACGGDEQAIGAEIQRYLKR